MDTIIKITEGGDVSHAIRIINQESTLGRTKKRERIVLSGIH